MFLNEPKLILLHTIKWFQVLLCITNNSIKHQSFVYTQLNVKTIQFSISHFFLCTQFKYQSSIWPIDRTLSGATTPSQSGSESDGNEGVLHIPQNSSITRASLSDCLVSYPGHSVGESYLSAKMQLVYSTAPANWAQAWTEVCHRIYGGWEVQAKWNWQKKCVMCMEKDVLIKKKKKFMNRLNVGLPIWVRVIK